MTGSEWLTLLTEAAQRAVAAYVARKAQSGVGTLLSWLDERVSQLSLNMSPTERGRLEGLLAETPTTYQWLLSFVEKDRQGIMIVGPSGAGKTHLMASLTQTVRETDRLSTVEIGEASAFFNGRLVVVRDTPGKPEHGGDLWKALGQHQPSVLVLVVAYGYLSPVGTGNRLWLGAHRHTERRKMEPFLRDARQEEVASIRQLTDLVTVPQEKVKHLVVVVNKMDVWLKNHAEALEYYRTDGAFQGAIRGLIDKVVRPGQTAQIVTAAAEYDSFKTQPPDGSFSREASTDSVRILKGLLAALLLDGKMS